jgi:[ribosomal protein S5]-alanine N-acetyltransferase
MDFTNLNELRADNLVLRKLSESDRQFISEMFDDSSVRKFYIVPKEARQDYRNLVPYLLNDFAQGSGFSWIIIEKGSGIFSKDKPCGFFAFEFRDSLKNARISYALKPEFRKRGIASKSAALVIEALESLGVTSVEADIDKDNQPSEKVVEKLGFITNKRQALVDPEMMRDGEIRFRHLWKKDLTLIPVNESETKTGRLGLNATQSELISAINKITTTITTTRQNPKLVAKYFYLLGRIKFNEGNYEEATEAFGRCNMIIMQENLPENHETFYWFARMRELENKPGDAKMYYGFALEKFSGDPELITKEEIELATRRIND